jgi:thiosulfate/3-mercaptopyruvate sulfurtransferase
MHMLESFVRRSAATPVLACAVAVCAGAWFGGAVYTGAQPSSVKPSEQSALPSPLIDAKGLQRLLRDPSLVLLHVGPKPDYDAGHIEGAQFLTSREFTVSDTATRTVYDLPGEADLRARLERLGISDNSKIVVVFGEDWGSPSTRLLFTLQAAGLGDNTRYLDGGTRAWKNAGLPLVTTVPTTPKPGKISAASNRALVVDHAWMQAHVGAPKVRIVDGRAPVFFDGPGMKHEGQPDMKAGHLPGAINIPFNTLVNDSVRVLSVEALRSIFRAAGVQPGDTVAAYCHIGQQGTTVLLAARILGHPIRLYDGSMADWENRKLPLVNEKAK